MDKKIGTLIKTLHIKRKMTNDINFDAVMLFYRDKNGVKQVDFVDRALVPFYMIKDTESDEAKSPPLFIEKDKVEKFEVFSDNLYREIAIKTDSLFYYDSFPPKARQLKNLLKHPWIYDSDMDISDRYIARFNREYEPNMEYRLHKGFFDIEVDLMPNGWTPDKKGHIGYIGFPDEDIAPCPINIISFVDGKAKVIHVFILENDKNTSQADFKNKEAEFKKYLLDKLADEHDTIMNDIIIYWMNSEEELITGFFNKVHEINPDFMNAWNSSFDINTMINRLEKLYRRKPSEIPPRQRVITSLSDGSLLYQKDRFGNDIYITPNMYYLSRKDSKIVDRLDDFYIVDGINWMDQMLYYANIRKTGGMKESYSLDAIVGEELGKEKLPLGPGETLKNLPWKNFWKFAEYNITDSVLLMLLEEKNLDMDMLQRLQEITDTRKEKVFRKTVSLKNFISKYAQENGFVLTSNKNSNYGEDGGRFENSFSLRNKIIEDNSRYQNQFEKKENYGAYVGDPVKNLPEGITDITGKPSSNIFENVFDEDFSSLYPSIIMAYNLSPNTQIGKFFLIDNDIKEKLITKFGYDGLFQISKSDEEADSGFSYAEDAGYDSVVLEGTDDLGPTLVDSLQSHNWTRIGEKFLDLPSVEDILAEIKEIKEE